MKDIRLSSIPASKLVSEIDALKQKIVEAEILQTTFNDPSLETDTIADSKRLIALYTEELDQRCSSFKVMITEIPEFKYRGKVLAPAQHFIRLSIPSYTYFTPNYDSDPYGNGDQYLSDIEIDDPIEFATLLIYCHTKSQNNKLL